MSPNPLVLVKKLAAPHRWFSARPANTDKEEYQTSKHHSEPIPGWYEHRKGRGWFLTAKDEDDGKPLEKPLAVRYSKALKRWMLESEYEARKRQAYVEGPDGKKVGVTFFRCDNGIAWIKCWNEDGEFISGPYEQWCIDEKTGKFRKMLRGDCPDFKERQSSRALAKATILEPPSSLPHTPVGLSDGTTLCARCSAPASAKSTRPSSTCTSSTKAASDAISTATTTPIKTLHADAGEFASELNKRLEHVQGG